VLSGRTPHPPTPDAQQCTDPHLPDHPCAQGLRFDGVNDYLQINTDFNLACVQ
jgi:hypothetical protein